MKEQYLPILIFIGLGIIIGSVPLILTRLLAPKKPNENKETPFECGFDAFEDARMRFDVRFYLVAILFIIFDLEIAFLFPFALVIREVGMIPFYSVLLFLLLLTVGFIYEWKKGALEWE